eukprot:TRINITY_DN9838_c0_g1_i2.p1 TRINITY_DN9838_c0_g1~~TRINITY_DN9838_c0_g1_i2.p1  ORF type:complete len:343 (+),score=61.37 TRINITY_DN9838_c0_g1_i2:60-1031(+)
MKTLFFLTLLIGAIASDASLAVHPDTVLAINTANVGWTASMEQGTFFANASVANVKGMLGVLPGGPALPPRPAPADDFSPPASFDASKNWPSCPSIMTIRDQSACGSCWAVAAAETMSDRYCTQGNLPNISISASNLMSCCDSCGNGCGGGYPEAAFRYWVSTGLDLESCQPYPFPRCEHHIPAGKYPKCPSNEYQTPPCKRACKDGSTPQKYKGSKAYGVSGERSLQEEIMTNGPVEVAFTVYSDFPTYKSGVYKRTSFIPLGGHAVKMIGWGVTESGTKYWIINNSWNEDWGNHGQFWILRGVDECGIESQGSAGHIAGHN